MKKRLLLAIIVLLPSALKGAVGDRFNGYGVWFTITVEANKYYNGVVKVGIDDGWITSHGSGEISIPSQVSFRGYQYNVESVADDAFRGSTELTSMVLPPTVKTIGERAFSGCTSLVSINIPDQVSKISSSTFEDCKSLSSIELNNVNTIASKAFYGCTNLPEVVFPIHLTSIGTNAFYGCTSLSSVTFHDEHVYILSGAFSNCTSLSSVYSYMTNITGLSSSDCFNNINSESILYVLSEMKASYENDLKWSSSFSQIKVIPLLNGDSFCASVPISDSSEIMEFEVVDTQALKVHIKSMQEGIVSSMSKTIDLEIPHFVTYNDYTYEIVGIGTSAFKNAKLSKLIVPEYIQSIEDNAFENCNELRSVHVFWRHPADVSVNKNCFDELSQVCLNIPAGTRERYEILAPWNKFAQIVESSPIFVGDISARFGSKADMPIYLKNTETVEGLQFKLTLPDGVSVVEQEGNLLASTTERTEGMTIMGRKDPDEENSYLFVLFSLDGNAINGTEGAIMNVRLDIAQDIELGVHDIKLEDVYMTTSTFETLNPAASLSELTIKDFMLGDVNNDGIINVTDAIGIVNHVLKNTPATFIEGAADVNEDGIINVTDAIGVINNILNK